MSSHHVVRDKQEPALVIANGEACSFELLGQLLEWSPTVVVLDGAVNRVEELGIKIDVILGDMDSITNLEEVQRRQHPVRIVPAPDQNYTDLEKAVFWLREEGYPAATLLWATGRRADHTANNMMSLFKFDGMDITLVDDHSRVFVLPKRFRKWYSKGTIISLLPFGLVEGVTIKGLEYELNHESLESGVRSGSSNRVPEDGWIEINHEKGRMLLMECID